MSIIGDHPDIPRFSDDLLGAMDKDPHAAERLLTAIDGWLGTNPWQTWQGFVQAHQPETKPLIDHVGPLRVRALMLVKQLPASLAPTAPRPAERLVTASENWIYAHTKATVQRTVMSQFLLVAPRLVAYPAEQVQEFRNEAVQDAWTTFFHVGCRRWNLREGAALRTWAHRIAFGRSIDYLRKLFRRGSPELPAEGDVELPEAPDRLTIAGVLGIDLKDFMQTLTSYQHELFGLYYLEGMTGAEIGERLGVETSAVHRTLCVISKKLGVFFR